jgi:hypothetical protein
MNRTTLAALAIAIAAVILPPSVRAAAPASQPYVELDSAPPPQGGNQLLSTFRVRLKLNPSAGTPTADDLADLVSRLRWRSGTTPDLPLMADFSSYAPVGNDEAVFVLQVGCPRDLVPASDAGAAKLSSERVTAVVVDGLRAALKPPASSPAADPAAAVRDLSDKIIHTQAMKQALLTLDAARPSSADMLKDRVQRLYTEKQRLEMALQAKRAREAALDQGMMIQKRKLEDLRSQDDVAEQLKKIVELREKDLKTTEMGVSSGLRTPSELAEAQAKLAEARVRVAERAASLNKTSAGQLLDRLADELATLSVDVTDMRIQLDEISQALRDLDPSRATTQSLEDAVSRNLVPASPADAASPLYKDLERQEHALIKQKLRLQIQEIALEVDKPQ